MIERNAKTITASKLKCPWAFSTFLRLTWSEFSRRRQSGPERRELFVGGLNIRNKCSVQKPRRKRKRVIIGTSKQLYLDKMLSANGNITEYRARVLIRKIYVMKEMEKEMATHSSILAWKIPWTEEPGRLQSMGSQSVGHDWVTSLHLCHKSTVIWLFILRVMELHWLFGRRDMITFSFYNNLSIVLRKYC